MSAKHLPPIVAFAGWPGAGKNTAAQALVQLGYREDSFAGPLKAMAVQLDPIVTVRFSEPVWLSDLLGGNDNWERAKREPGSRRYLQDLGKAVRDHLGADTWLNAAIERYTSHFLPTGQQHPTVITDCRYRNEAEWVQSVRWESWEDEDGPIITKSRLIWLDRDGCGPPNDHESASGVCRELADHRIANNGTVEELHAEVLRVLGLEVAR